MTHLLDTSAILAYYFEEHGADSVQALLADTKNPPAIYCITELEFWARLKSLDADAHFQSDWRELSTLLKTLPLDAGIVGRAVEIRRASLNKLPTVDSLIAATE
jgi:PIN domain nuclease of toxin-antitoxin system